MGYFSPRTRGQVVAAIRDRTGVRTEWITVALDKWDANAQPERCAEEVKGKEYGLASDCRCRGCFERTCFAMFSQVKAQGIK